MVENPPANAGDSKDMDLFFPGSERSPGERKWQSTPVFLLEIPWIGEPGRLQSIELQKSDRT